MTHQNSNQSALVGLFMGSLRPIIAISIIAFGILLITTIVQLNNVMLVHQTEERIIVLFSINTIPILITLVGFFGIYKNHKTCLMVFCSMITIHAIFCFAFIVFAFISNFAAVRTEKLSKELEQSMPLYRWTVDDHEQEADYSDKNKAEKEKATLIWDGVQSLKCCGLKQPHDWAKYAQASDKIIELHYPKSCCQKPFEQTPTGSSQTYAICDASCKLYMDGCRPKLDSMHESMIETLGVLIVLQLFLAIIAHLYCSQIDPTNALAPFSSLTEQQQLDLARFIEESPAFSRLRQQQPSSSALTSTSMATTTTTPTPTPVSPLALEPHLQVQVESQSQSPAGKSLYARGQSTRWSR